MPCKDPKGKRHSGQGNERTIERKDKSEYEKNSCLEKGYCDRQNTLYATLPRNNKENAITAQVTAITKSCESAFSAMRHGKVNKFYNLGQKAKKNTTKSLFVRGTTKEMGSQYLQAQTERGEHCYQ